MVGFKRGGGGGGRGLVRKEEYSNGCPLCGYFLCL